MATETRHFVNGRFIVSLFALVITVGVSFTGGVIGAITTVGDLDKRVTVIESNRFTQRQGWSLQTANTQMYRDTLDRVRDLELRLKMLDGICTKVLKERKLLEVEEEEQ